MRPPVACCRSCRTPIVAVVTCGPSTHVLEPCGCRASTRTVNALSNGLDRGRGIAADGGREVQPALTDLHAFRRDVLFAVRTLEREDRPPIGLRVKQFLEVEYAEDVNHSRLYQNLDALADHGLLEKGKRDGRTNEYATTTQGRQLLEAHARQRLKQANIELDDPDNTVHQSTGVTDA